MPSHQLRVKVDLRDVSLFNDLMRDRPQVNDVFVREHSDVWTFNGDEEQCEEMQCEIEDILNCGCVNLDELSILEL